MAVFMKNMGEPLGVKNTNAYIVLRYICIYS